MGFILPLNVYLLAYKYIAFIDLLCREEYSMELKNKVAVVTGGAHGIGRALCRALHIEGVQVAVADLDIDAAEKVAAEIDGMALRVDVSQEQEICSAVERICIQCRYHIWRRSERCRFSARRTLASQSGC
jgi:FlaA1/EpsC-like NDP-sugar epimerase